MQLITYPKRQEWAALLQRPSATNADIEHVVSGIMEAVKKEGDIAVKRYTEKFDGVSPDVLHITDTEWTAADNIEPSLKEAILIAISNIRTFHTAQKERPIVLETMPGVMCMRRSVPIERIGLYIPGGSAPLFSTLMMLAVPAVIAGCKEIVCCTPPDKNGNIHPAILFIAKQLGISQLYKAGGVQAIAAMAYGTATVPKIYKLFGPGNRYVTCAKMLLAKEGIAIDIPAGPSEVAVLADDSCMPSFVAADLLSQAEHGADSQVILVSNSQEVIEKVEHEITAQLSLLPRQEIAARALLNSKAILITDIEEGIALVNTYAPEHLIVACKDEDAIAEKITNAGSVFLGNYSPESAGDYASGTNHTLPTNGYAQAYSGVSLDSFVKKITFQKISREGLQNIGSAVETLAMAEGLKAHANAVTIRLQTENSSSK